MNELPSYAELHCVSNFTFLRGASTADELFHRASQLGYTALAITDECSFAGIVRAWQASRKFGVRLICGTEVNLVEGMKLVLLATSHAGYTSLCHFITQARRRSPKGEYEARESDLKSLGDDVVALWIPDAAQALDSIETKEQAERLAARFGARAKLAVELHRGADDAERLAALLALAAESNLEPVAAGDVHMHVRSRRALQDTVTAIRHNTTIADAGFKLFPNGERHLRHRRALATLYPRELLDASVRIARQCAFSLDELHYEYPHELVPAGLTPSEHLRRLTYEGAKERYPDGMPDEVRAQVEAELELIAELRYEAFFLTVEDVVRYARGRNILCQGRGSAANSAVCYCLHITEVDPSTFKLLFERFMSKRRNEPPDIDVDFEHERREEVIQYIYRRYGRDRAALAATVISYQPKSAIRDVGKALGLSLDQVDALAKSLAWWDDSQTFAERVRERGLDLEAPVMRRLLELVDDLIKFPRHLSQHVGGFVVSEHPITSLVPIENAAMPDRTIIQWDKDDLEALCLLKVDCLALGMLTCLHRCFDMVSALRREQWTIASIPKDDPATYDMIRRADTLGVFQIESRAQMSMLPRLKPQHFYDLVIQIAIVRPGPIQGGMVHPYLRRRTGMEPVVFAKEELRPVLERTLGVPIFQEQVIRLAMVAAGFSADEADDLRRSMAAWKRHGGLQKHEQRLLDGMREKGYPDEFAHQIFEQIKGFGSYGFPESHSASFALLAYASSWLKCHEPAAYACALLNSQPMGFYAPAQIIQEVRRHGVMVRPADVCDSDWDSTLEPLAPSRPGDEADRPQPAIRIGLRLIRGLSEKVAQRIVAARRDRPFEDVQDLVQRAHLEPSERDHLADAAALKSLAGHRHRARWTAQGAHRAPDLFTTLHIEDQPTALRVPTSIEDTVSDYAELGFTLGKHPVSLVRRDLQRLRIRSAAQLAQQPTGTQVHAAGLVTVRQRPGSASGTVFVTIEDETGVVNVVVWPNLVAEQRRELLGAKLLAVEGRLERTDAVTHLIASRLADLSHLLAPLAARSRNFH